VSEIALRGAFAAGDFRGGCELVLLLPVSFSARNLETGRLLSRCIWLCVGYSCARGSAATLGYRSAVTYCRRSRTT